MHFTLKNEELQQQQKGILHSLHLVGFRELLLSMSTYLLQLIVLCKDISLADWKNGVFRLTKDRERLTMALEDATVSLKELEDLTDVARVVMDMVDPPEDGVPDARSLLEWLREAPTRISNFVSENNRVFVSHVLGW